MQAFDDVEVLQTAALDGSMLRLWPHHWDTVRTQSLTAICCWSVLSFAAFAFSSYEWLDVASFYPPACAYLFQLQIVLLITNAHTAKLPNSCPVDSNNSTRTKQGLNMTGLPLVPETYTK